MPAIPQTPLLPANTFHRHVGKWHTGFDISIGFGAVLVFLFALAVYFLVVYIKADELSELRRTIKTQRKELRKVRKDAERGVLNGDAHVGEGYGTIEDRKRQERLGKIVPYKPIEGRPGV